MGHMHWRGTVIAPQGSRTQRATGRPEEPRAGLNSGLAPGSGVQVRGTLVRTPGAGRHRWGSGRAWLGRLVWTKPGWHDLCPVQWDLVCDSRRLKEVAQSVFMAGTLVGGIVLGDLSDR